MNKTTKKWNLTGLLDDLNESQKDECSLILENVAQILVKTKPVITSSIFEFVMCMTRRIYEKLGTEKFPDVDWFVKDAQEYFNKNKLLIEDLNSYIALDGDAEIRSFYETVLLNKLKENRL